MAGPAGQVGVGQSSLVTLWASAAHRCVLRRTRGKYELLLYRDGSVIRLDTCADEHTARGLAQEWLIALESLLFQ
jgi:hypothetical protein